MRAPGPVGQARSGKLPSAWARQRNEREKETRQEEKSIFYHVITSVDIIYIHYPFVIVVYNNRFLTPNNIPLLDISFILFYNKNNV